MSDGKNWRCWCQCWWWWDIIGVKLGQDIPVRETEHKTQLTFAAWIFLLKLTLPSSSSSTASTSPPFNVVCSLGGWTDTKEDGCLSRKPFIPQFSHFSFTPAFNNKIDLFKKSVWCQKTKSKCVFGVRNPVLVSNFELKMVSLSQMPQFSQCLKSPIFQISQISITLQNMLEVDNSLNLILRQTKKEKRDWLILKDYSIHKRTSNDNFS